MLNLFDFECTNQADKWWWEDDEEQVWTEEMIIDLGFSGEKTHDATRSFIQSLLHVRFPTRFAEMGDNLVLLKRTQINEKDALKMTLYKYGMNEQDIDYNKVVALNTMDVGSLWELCRAINNFQIDDWREGVKGRKRWLKYISLDGRAEKLKQGLLKLYEKILSTKLQ
tara:strand:+ start:904 stop:1407 length:504 start_codon:yes stop_codon:yes gene_type:complete